MREVNDVLILRGTLEGASKEKGGGGFKLPAWAEYPLEHLESLGRDWTVVEAFWQRQVDVGGVLLSVHYRRFVAKSNRVSELLGLQGGAVWKTIRGARFERKNGVVNNHVITHFVSLETLREARATLVKVFSALKAAGVLWVTQETLEAVRDKKLLVNGMTPARLWTFLKDAAYVDRLAVDQLPDELKESAITSFYRTGVALSQLLAEFGLSLTPDYFLDENTVLLTPEQRRRLVEKAGCFISMSLSDLAEIPALDFSPDVPMGRDRLPPPGDEPVVGVIDSLFCEEAYFSDWVEVHNQPALAVNRPLTAADYAHGTAVSSLIVDGPAANPRLDDGCGRFRVRHFGVATTGRISQFHLMKAVRDIVRGNPDIRVWNLSLGARYETKEDFISPEAAILDELQSECNVIFVVAATNSPDSSPMRLGAPADTINGVSVGAVNRQGAPTAYTRHGPVLNFFVKPDVACFGGEGADGINVCTGSAKSLNSGAMKVGTSFSAPWITRKLAYLIHRMGLSRETAKALLIDCAVGWGRYPDPEWHRVGYGRVPVRIEDILHTATDEIRFVIHGKTKAYRTSHYAIPVPRNRDGDFNYSVRATVCYFPHCCREQGVDYTTTELDVRFGRVTGAEGAQDVKDIRLPLKEDPRFQWIPEKEARMMFQKWSNVKVFKDEIVKSRKAYTPYWGFRADLMDRLNTFSERGMPFTLVVTLKEKDGVNGIHRFIKSCQVSGWVVETLKVEQRLAVHEKAEAELELT